MGRADMLPELPRALIHLGGIVVNTVRDGLLGDLSAMAHKLLRSARKAMSGCPAAKLSMG
jgi:hypothetical protein